MIIARGDNNNFVRPKKSLESPKSEPDNPDFLEHLPLVSTSQ